MEYIDKVVKREILKVAPNAELTDDTDLTKDLGLDSLDMVEVYMNIENEFNIKVSDEEISKCGTRIKDIKELVQKYVTAK